MPPIVFERLHEDVQEPTRATEWSAGYDLRAYLKDRTVKVYGANNAEYLLYLPPENPTLTLMPGDRAMVPTGFKAQLPPGYEAQIRPRSSVALKVGLGVVNSPGTIDADFPHEWMVLVVNTSSVPLVIDHGERIAQFVLARYEVLFFAWGTVSQVTNRTGGIGSTGK